MVFVAGDIVPGVPVLMIFERFHLRRIEAKAVKITRMGETTAAAIP